MQNKTKGRPAEKATTSSRAPGQGKKAALVLTASPGAGDDIPLSIPLSQTRTPKAQMGK